MKTIKTADATDAALDWLVWKCLGGPDPWFDTVGTWWVNIEGKDRALSTGWAQSFTPSTSWAHGGPIIDRELIAVSPYGYMDEAWRATTLKPEKHFTAYGDTCLIAAMRCFVASKLGDTVEVPEELSP